MLPRQQWITPQHFYAWQQYCRVKNSCCHIIALLLTAAGAEESEKRVTYYCTERKSKSNHIGLLISTATRGLMRWKGQMPAAQRLPGVADTVSRTRTRAGWMEEDAQKAQGQQLFPLYGRQAAMMSSTPITERRRRSARRLGVAATAISLACCRPSPANPIKELAASITSVCSCDTTTLPPEIHESIARPSSFSPWRAAGSGLPGYAIRRVLGMELISCTSPL